MRLHGHANLYQRLESVFGHAKKVGRTAPNIHKERKRERKEERKK